MEITQQSNCLLVDMSKILNNHACLKQKAKVDHGPV